MASLTQTLYTPEEYLALEREAEYKSEYINGRIYAMSGASREHNLISVNLLREISGQLMGRLCEVYGGDMRVNVSSTGLYTYPDVTAVCGESIFADTEMDTLANPTVLIEVLSPSTEAYDRGEKFAHYRRLPTLQEYVLVAQDKVRIEHYVWREAEWVLSEISDLDGILDLTSISCEVALRNIYNKVQFSVQT